MYYKNLFILLEIGPKPIWNETHLDRLKKDLLMNYDKYARPENHEDQTHVDIAVSIFHIETEEAKSILNVLCWFRLVRGNLLEKFIW